MVAWKPPTIIFAFGASSRARAASRRLADRGRQRRDADEIRLRFNQELLPGLALLRDLEVHDARGVPSLGDIRGQVAEAQRR